MLATEAGWAHIVRFLVEQMSTVLELVDSGGFNATDLAALNGYLSHEEKGRNADVADIVNYLKDHGLEYTRTGHFCEGGYQMWVCVPEGARAAKARAPEGVRAKRSRIRARALEGARARGRACQ